jgi:uncharacterized protein (TIGR03435 family)
MRAALVFVLAAIGYAQDFVVVSVKRNVVPPQMAGGVGGISGGPGSSDPTRLRIEAQNLLQILMLAYGVPADQISGPSWLSSPDWRYDVRAILPPETNRQEMRDMLRKAVRERFQLSIHRETREIPAYNLVVGSSGPKIKPTAYPDAKLGSPGFGETDRDGCPAFPPRVAGMQGRIVTGTLMCRTYASVSIADFIRSLGAEMSGGNMLAPMRISDRTGLGGQYDFHLLAEAVLPPGVPHPEGDTGAPIEIAIQQQLGLVLQPTKVPAEVVVVDQAIRMPLPD